MAAKQAELVNDDHRYLLAVGSKMTGKTVGCAHKMAKHLAYVDNAHVGVIVKRSEVGRIGIWPDLTEFVIPTYWQAEAGVIPYLVRPRVLSDTKRRVFSVRNMRGGESRCTLISAFRQSEIEENLKNTRFSMVYINEADQFTADIFQCAADQLRLHHLGVSDDDHQLILDCNPPDQGEKHWLYPLFIDPEERLDSWVRDFSVLRFYLDDNPWLLPRQYEDLMNRYKGDRRKYARYVLGQWIPSAEGSLFSDVFSDETHIIGEIHPGKPRNQWQVLLPPRGTCELVRCFDPGDVNHACVFFTKRLMGGKYVYDVLDDVISVGKPLSLSRFAKLVIAKSDYWENVLLSRGADSVVVRDWADPSAFNYKSSGIGQTQAMELHVATQGRISLRPARKGPGSVSNRISQVTSLLAENRLVFSALAQDTINSFIGLKKDKSDKLGPKNLVHAFDALSYGLISEFAHDIREEAESSIPDQHAHQGMVSVRL